MLVEDELKVKLREISLQTKTALHFSGYPLAKGLLGSKNNEIEIKYLYRRQTYRLLLEKLTTISDQVISDGKIIIVQTNPILKFIPFYKVRTISGIPVFVPYNDSSEKACEIDSKHRGVTINSIFYCIETNIIKDFNNALASLGKKLVSVGNPLDRLLEDPARVIKTFAYAAELNKNISSHYMKAMAKFISAEKLLNVGHCLKWLNKILLSSLPSKYINGLFKVGALDFIFPFLAKSAGITQNEYHKEDIYTHCLHTCDSVEPDLVLRLAALLHDVGKLETRKIIDNKVTFHSHEVVSEFMAEHMLKRLGYEKPIIKEVSFLVREHMYNYTDDWTDRTLERFIKKLNLNKNINPEDVKLFKLRGGDRVSKGLSRKASSQQKLEQRIHNYFKEV